MLDTLAEGGELGTNEIARRTGMTPSTVSRQLGTLAASGLVERVSATGATGSGYGSCISRTHSSPGSTCARRTAASRGARAATGETATLSVPGERGRDHGRLRPRRPPGAAGLAPRQALDRARDLGREGHARVLRARAPGGAVPRVHAADDHRRAGARGERSRVVRERGYAEAVGEREPDLTAIAAPIRSSRGELEAIVALQGPSSRFDPEAVAAALPLLLERAEAMSSELGWRPG